MLRLTYDLKPIHGEKKMRIPLLCGLFALSVGCLVAGSRAQAPASEPKKVRLTPSQNVLLETDGKARRVLIEATVIHREANLELEEFLCRQHNKEHESILSGDFDARDVHATLLAAGAKAGTPVVYHPDYKPATGSRIRVSVRHPGPDGKVLTSNARDWVKNHKTGKELASDWVFAGSGFTDNPEDPKKPIYLANQGDVICLSNFNTAMLDLPIASSQKAGELLFFPWTDRIPPVGTKVTVVLEVVGDSK